jgi:ubiquinone/menaquinone biosynthesis C-methylase UbiE
MTLLDCGCAAGSITLGLAKAVKPGQVTGVDISEIEIERARKRASEAKIRNISFETGEIYRLEYSDNTFDALFCNNVLEHLPEPSIPLQEMRRVLKVGGIVGIADLDWGGLLLVADDELIEKFCVIFESDWQNEGGHPRLGRHVGRLLHEAGFMEIEMFAYYDVFSDYERRRLMAETAVSRTTEADFVDRITQSGLATVEELQAMKNAWEKWQDVPGGILAHAQCAAIGWKM